MEARISIITITVENLEKSYQFYHTGLGLPTTRNPDSGIIFFKTSGVCLALYPKEKFKEEVDCEVLQPNGVMGNISLAHNVKSKEEVDAILSKAKDAGAIIRKKAQETFWGGYSGYFSDPDGILWEIAWGAFDFNSDGSLKIT